MGIRTHAVYRSSVYHQSAYHSSVYQDLSQSPSRKPFYVRKSWRGWYQASKVATVKDWPTTSVLILKDEMFHAPTQSCNGGVHLNDCSRLFPPATSRENPVMRYTDRVLCGLQPPESPKSILNSACNNSMNRLDLRRLSSLIPTHTSQEWDDDR